MNISDKILQLTEKKGFTKKKIYTKLGITQPGFDKKIEKDFFTSPEIKLLSELFGVPETYFFEKEPTFGTEAKLRKAYKVPVKAFAGYVSKGFETIKAEELEEIYILDKNYPEDVRCFEVEGDSMQPSIDWNDVVICTRVQEEQELKKGKIYLFVTENNILVKVLGGIGSTDLLLQSLNKEYKDLILKKDEIKEIWLVIAMMREF